MTPRYLVDPGDLVDVLKGKTLHEFGDKLAPVLIFYSTFHLKISARQTPMAEPHLCSWNTLPCVHPRSEIPHE